MSEDNFMNAVEMLIFVDEQLHLSKKQFQQCLIKLLVKYEKEEMIRIS